MNSEYVWLTEDSQRFLDGGYLLPGQTVDDRVSVICDAAQEILKKPGFAARLKENFKKGWYSFSTPVWANFGTDRALPISCFGCLPAQDSLASILSMHAEVGMMTKHGGGTSGYFGNIRERGSEIYQNGQSSGSVNFMQLYDCLLKIVSQGSTRQGSFATWLPISHGDIMEFLTLRSEGSPIQTLHFGVTVTDAWMESMIAGDQDKRVVWAKVLESRASKGEPYILFVDNVNRGTVDVYKENNMAITHSNLCVTGDQRVVSDRGLKTAKELYEEGGDLTLFDNFGAVKSTPMRLIERDADVYKITLDNGMTHTVTGYHKVKTRLASHDGYYQYSDVECLALEPGDHVAIQFKKGLFGVVSRSEDAKSLGEYHRAEIRNTSSSIPDWLWAGDEKTHLAYVGGFLGRELFVHENIRTEWYETADSIHQDLLRDIQIIATNLGCDAKLEFNDGEWRLQIIDLLLMRRYAGVKKIEHVGKEDVYCCTVDTNEHHWVCNGVVTTNCTEIMLPDSEDESFVCDLSSMNDVYFDDWKDTDAVEILVCLLDAVMTDFINRAKNIPYMERAVRFAERHRAIGIGQFGWHSYLQSKMVAFESMEAKRLNVKIAKTIRDSAYAASAKLAAEYGEPELLKGRGRRNTTLCAIAPTTSSAFIIGQRSEGIEPEQDNYCIKDLAKGKFTIRNKFLADLLDKKGKNTPKVWDSILKNSGSVQHLDFLDENEKAVFRTFAEISPKEIIIQAAQRQKYIDQGQSLNLMIHPSISVKDVNALMIEAWRLGVKSLYYQKSVNAAQQFARNILSCASCES